MIKYLSLTFTKIECWEVDRLECRFWDCALNGMFKWGVFERNFIIGGKILLINLKKALESFFQLYYDLLWFKNCEIKAIKDRNSYLKRSQALKTPQKRLRIGPKVSPEELTYIKCIYLNKFLYWILNDLNPERNEWGEKKSNILIFKRDTNWLFHFIYVLFGVDEY